MPALLANLYQAVSRSSAIVTLGVQAAIVDDERRVLLVRHGYRAGWHFPGGGVERHETVEAALNRELLEETGVILTRPPQLIGIYTQFDIFPGDHIVLYYAQDWQRKAVPMPNLEITAQGFFAMDALPDDIAPATRRRIGELHSGAPVATTW